MRRLALFVAVAGAVLAPAAPASAHGGDAPGATAYRTRITGISAPEKGLRIRTVEAGARLELHNGTGHAVEVLGYSGEPYLDIRPDGTYQNVNSPAAYLNQTLAGDTPVPPNADPTAMPQWRQISTGTTVRWHDQRTHWLSSGRPPEAIADPGRVHRLRDWVVPLRVQVRTFELRGTLDWVPPPRAWLWWVGTALLGAGASALLVRRPRWVPPLALIGGLCPLLYATTQATDGAAAPLALVLSGLLPLAAAYRHPPFFLALSGAVLALFGGFAQLAALSAAVLPATGPAWLSRTAVMISLSVGAALCLAGLLRLRAAVPPRPPASHPAPAPSSQPVVPA